MVIGSLSPVAFVAKNEVRKWPLIGITAEIQRTVFVDRARRNQTSDAIGKIVKRLASGTSVVLIAEGTSSDGNRVLPFRSALIGAIKHAAEQGDVVGGAADVLIQPMSICYTDLHGIPTGRQHRPLVAWYGNLDFMPHIKAFIEHGVDAVVSYGEPVAADGEADRKEMTKTLEGAVRELTTTALLGRPRAAQPIAA